jgi:hypothetical protein
MRETQIMFWASLLKHHADEGLSVQDAGEILDDVIEHNKDVGGVFTAIMEAVDDALPFKEQGNTSPDAVPEKLATGSRKRSKEKSSTRGSNSDVPQQGAA